MEGSKYLSLNRRGKPTYVQYFYVSFCHISGAPFNNSAVGLTIEQAGASEGALAAPNDEYEHTYADMRERMPPPVIGLEQCPTGVPANVDNVTTGQDASKLPIE
jgi:hypothetical protein